MRGPANQAAAVDAPVAPRLHTMHYWRRATAQHRCMNMRIAVHLVLLGASLVLFTGCLSHRSCHVAFAPDHTDVELCKDWYGLIPGICGSTTHASYDYTFRMPGQKAKYRDNEIQLVLTEPHWVPTYSGVISIDRDKRHVVVKLRERGDDKKESPFELNGRYHYR